MKIKSEFRKTFKIKPTDKIHIFSAPGRVNLIGEHTDYNDGFVFPCAINKSIIVAASLRDDNTLDMSSADFKSRITCNLKDIKYRKSDSWGNYPKGIAKTLLDMGCKIGGLNLLYQGNIPIASGLSSSAAIEIVTAVCMNELFRLNIGRRELALLAQKTENEFIGMKCGIMDQFVIAFGRENHALFIDCRSLSYKLVPLKLKGISIVIANTKVKRKLVDSEYNKRRQECEQGVKILRKYNPAIKKLRDASILFFEKHKSSLPEIIRKRCQHIIYENGRVRKAVQFLQKNNLCEFGNLMIEAHASIRDLYQVSCFELDTMVEEALKIKGTIGARMTGAGFGGCTVNLVKNEYISEFIDKVGRNYKKKTGITPEFYVSSPADGAKQLE